MSFLSFPSTGAVTSVISDTGMITFTAGEAVTAASYQVGRDADGTNQLHFNVPTGATFEFSINDTVEMTLSASAVDFKNNSLTTTGGGSLTGTWSDLGTVTTVDINGGTMDAVVIGGFSPAAGTFTTLNANGGGALTGTWTNLGTVTTVDINGGTLDGVIIGGASAAAATFTTISQSSLTTWSAGVAITAGSYQIGRDADGTNQLHFNVPTGATFEFSVNDAVEFTLSATAANFQNNSITTTGGGSLTGTWSDLGTVTTIDINGGTVDGATIGGSSAGAGTFTTLTATGLLTLSVTAAITASTTQTQGQGPLTKTVNEVSVCANANDTVTLPTAAAGVVVYIIHNGAQTLRVYPASGDNIDGAGVNTAVTQGAGTNLLYVAHDATNWNLIHSAL